MFTLKILENLKVKGWTMRGSRRQKEIIKNFRKI